MPVIFSTEGPINLDALLTFGVNAKDSDKPNPIGFFGTGFKYALACILRGGGSLKIVDGASEITFRTETQVIREKSFHFIYMGQTKLGFTTALGPLWKPWMAFRELEANTRDEGGNTWALSYTPEEFHPDFAHIIVDWPPFQQAWRDRDLYFLPKKEPISQNYGVEIYKGETSTIYYRGMACLTLKPDKDGASIEARHRRCLYTYNITCDLELTEDRTIKHPFMVDYYITNALRNTCSRDILADALIATGEYYESGLAFDNDEPVAPTFLSVVQSLTQNPMTYGRVNRTAEAACKKSNPEQMLATVPLNAIQYSLFQDALIILKQYLQAEIDPAIVFTCATLGPNILGQYANKKIYLSLSAYDSLHQLVGTLYEEWCHMTGGFSDLSRAFQNHLLNQLITQVFARRTAGFSF